MKTSTKPETLLLARLEGAVPMGTIRQGDPHELSIATAFWTTAETLEDLYRNLRSDPESPVLLKGDFNPKLVRDAVTRSGASMRCRVLTH